MLQPGASEAVSIQVNENGSSHPLSYWDTTSGSWQVAPGTYTVYLGNSSRASDLQTVGAFTVSQYAALKSALDTPRQARIQLLFVDS
jgi:hypothetical protein